MASPTPEAQGKGAAYIFLGPELGKKQGAINEIRRKMQGCEETVLYAGETPISQIIFEIQNQNLFASTRLLLIKNAEAFKVQTIKEKTEVALLASCLHELNEGTAVILISDEIRITAGLDDAAPKDNRRIFYELFENEKNEWVRNFFGQQGFTIDDEGIETVLELVENNTEALSRECLRLTQFLKKPDEKVQAIRADDMEKWLSHNREESAFTLFSRIAAGDFPKAMDSLAAILAEKKFNERTPQITMAGITSCFRKLRAYHTLAESGRIDNFELKKIGISFPRARDEYAMAARRYNAQAAEACLAVTAEYELLLRSMGNALESVLIDTWLIKIYDLAA